MQESVAHKLIRDLLKDGKLQDKMLVFDPNTKKEFLISIEIASAAEGILTRSTLNPAGSLCSCCQGSGRA